MTTEEIAQLTKIRHDLFNAVNEKDLLAIKFEINNIDTMIYKAVKSKTDETKA